MTSHVIRGPGELIATIPMMLGVTPSEAVVIVALSGRGEIVATMRVDRDDLLVPDLADEVGASVRAQLRRARAVTALLVSYTEDDVTIGCDGADALLRCIDTVLEHTSVWTTDGETYRSPGCADVQCCPPGGTPVPPIAADPWEDDACARLEAEIRQQQRPVASPRDRRRAARAGDRAWRRRELGEAAWRQDALASVIASMAPGAEALELGRAAVALRDVRVRDALIVRWLHGSDRAVCDVLDGRSTVEVAQALDGVLIDRDQGPPDHTEVRFALDWCDAMSALARRRDQAAIHSLRALVYWYDGNLPGAGMAASDALACDDGYSLAGLVRDVCAARLEPAWVSQRLS